ncbi:MAG: type II secretion system protein [Roseibacillus sp.]
MNHKHRGFTLIELLVVITIILLLAALTFSFVKRGTQAAYASRCINNLKSIASTHVAMTGDNNGNFIHPGRTKMYGSRRGWAMHFTVAAHPGVDAQSWAKVNDRVTALQMLNCPSAYAKKKTEMADVEGHGRWRTYGINTRIGAVENQYNGGGGNSIGGHVTGATRPDQVEDPSLLVMAADTNFGNRQYRNAFGPFNVKRFGLGEHHSDGFHVAYLDGHVERHTMKTFPYPDNTLPDGRVMKFRNVPRTEEEKYMALTWKGTIYRRSMPSTPNPN